MQKVALLGLGIMGSGIASNLLKAGFTLTVYNRTPAKADQLIALGARFAATPKLAAEDADVIISMVGDDTASREVWLSDRGALKGAKADAVLVECSTLSPDWVRQLAGIANQSNLTLIDSPVAGSKDAANSGQLRLFVGGPAEAVEKATPVLQAFSSAIVHLGPVGAGAEWKLINNMMTAVQMVAVSEGIALAERAGLNMEQVVPLILNSAAASPIVKGKMDRLTARRYTDTDFALKWMEKDAQYALAMGEDYSVTLKTVAAAYEVLRVARERGLGDLDFSAVIEAIRQPD